MQTEDVTLYDTSGDGLFYSPFDLKLDPMACLLLINFNKDPDAIYNAFEPQVFDDPQHGRGLMVIAYLPDTRFDIYHQPGLRLDRATYDIVGKGLRELVERPMADAVFDIGPTGVRLDMRFDDFAGRPVGLWIQERGDKPTKPFTILAPLGDTTESPPALPLFHLYDFYFVRRAGTDVVISVDGRARKPDSIPMILDGARVHFLRYAADPFLASWNEGSERELRPIPVTDGQTLVHDGAVTYELARRDGRAEIAAMSIANERHALRIGFDPPVPDVSGIRDGVIVPGTFSIRGDAGSGVVSGVYSLARVGENVDINVRPSDGWQPEVDRWGVKLIFALVPVFRKWPTTYEWTARLTLQEGAPPVMRSAWRRAGRAEKSRALRLFGD